MQTLDWIHGKDPQSFLKIKQKQLKDHFFGSAPAPFIGHHNYPYVNVGILSPGMLVNNAELYDDPKTWSKDNYSIPSISALRQELVNSKFRSYIKSQSRMLEISKEIGITSKPAEVEIQLKKRPNISFTSDNYTAPIGPRADIKLAKITSNTKINGSVQKAVDDTDLKARDALTHLYKKGLDDTFLQRILSVGQLGIGKNRKLVPTRWSITATDDTLSKHLLEKIRYNKESNIEARYGGHLGNYFLIITLPGPWSYELFEIVVEKSKEALYYSTDFEGPFSRNDYAKETVGGYYATRLAILEKLNENKCKGSILVLRFITKEYTTPLGVWVVREAVRKAMESKPLKFGDEKLILIYAKSLAHKKHGLNIFSILNKSSILLETRKKQHSLTQYF